MRIVIGLAVLVAIVLAACGIPAKDTRIGVVAPSLASFPPVGDVMDLRCGSLDCHGSARRNFIVWGCEGLRLDPTMGPTCGRGSETTSDEYAETYDSLVGLEPAVMTEVVEGGGEHPELLTFIRKARGEEAHKGGAPIKVGDASDQCFVRWLAGAAAEDPTFLAICTSALQTQ